MQQGSQPQKGENVLVAIGGNATSTFGDAHKTVLRAVEELASEFGDVKLSYLYQTPAYPAGSGPDFVNGAVKFNSDLPATSLLEALHRIEAEFGRTRELRWSQRTLDLDLIAYGVAVLPDSETFSQWKDMPLESQKTLVPEELILPHPRIQDRPFVLVPLADIAPDWVHPVLKLTVLQMVAEFAPDDIAQIQRI